MKTITLKSDNRFFDKLTTMAETFNLSKSELIRQAVIHYEKTLEKQKLKEQIKKASLHVRKETLQVNHEFDALLDDGLAQ